LIRHGTIQSVTEESIAVTADGDHHRRERRNSGTPQSHQQAQRQAEIFQSAHRSAMINDTPGIDKCGVRSARPDFRHGLPAPAWYVVLVEVRQQVDDARPVVLAEIAGGLVGKQDRRLHGERPRNRHRALFAAESWRG
jgi:hypothetical protein